jgi:hypothetical protein
MSDKYLLNKYRDVEAEGRTIDEIRGHIHDHLLAGVRPENLRVLAGVLSEPLYEKILIAEEMVDVVIERLSPGDRVCGVLVV